MRDDRELAAVNYRPSMNTVVLDTVRVYTQVNVDAAMMKYAKDSGDWQMLEYEDAYAKRSMLRAFGRTKKYEVKVPATWWQHLKLALRTRFPRLGKRFKVRMTATVIDTGAVVADLPPEVVADHYVIPYSLPPRLEFSTK